MTRRAPFRLTRSGVLLALISASFASGGASAAAGRVEFVLGGVTVAARDGQARPLVRGAEVDTGDIVRTNDGRAQIRFADGAYVSLQPESEFNIAEYRFEGKAEGSERGFFGLLKGAMRTVTGAIGRSNRNNYRLTTPTATVGIRGTGGVIQVLPDGSTLVIGTSGTWFVSNPAGTLDVPAGTSVLAPADPKDPPRESATQPTSGPAPLPPEAPLFVQGEQVNPIGVPLGLIDPLLSGSSYAAVAATSALDPASNATALFDTVGQMTSMTFGSGSAYALVAGSHANFGTDGVLAWGRWIGTATVPGPNGPIAATYDGNQGMHYVIGLPTPIMPTTGGGTYILTGATSPTYVSGKTAPGTFSGSLNVDFNQGSLGMNLNVAMPDGNAYDMTGTASARANQFSASLTCTSRSCGGTAQGFFSGANAERAGLGYQILDSVNGDILGAAAFRKQ